MPNGKHVCWIISPGGAAKKVICKSGLPRLEENTRAGDQLGYTRVLTVDGPEENAGFVLVHKHDQVIMPDADKKGFVYTGQIMSEITI